MPKFLIPKEAQDDLISLCKTDLKKVEDLIAISDSSLATSLRKFDVLSRIADALNISLNDAYDIAMLIDFLSKQKEVSKASDDEFISEIQGVLEEKIGKEATKDLMNQSRKQAILKLFGKKLIAEIAKKKEKLETGLLKTLISIEGTCELRPLFNLERSHIVDKVYTVITRLSLEDDMENKENFVFQMNNESLKRLKEFIEITENKLKIMETEIIPVESKND